MVYVNYISKYFVVAISLLVFGQIRGFSQTCCSGGVPLSGNIGFQGAASGTLQMEFSYDLNYLATLKTGDVTYEDGTRQRTTHSFLLKTGYSINRWFAIDALFSYVLQGRKISFNDQIDQVNTHGLGDAVLMAKFILSNISESGSELQLGIGPKLPLGRTDLTNNLDITLNADMQPGSGSWDLITWAYYARQFAKRPTMVASARVVGRINGMNREYLGSQTYSFGNSVQFYLGIGDQVVWGNRILSPSLSVRYRYAAGDRINDQELDNTGGQWINVLPALSWHFSPRSILHFVPEIPLYSNVGGTQLTPTFRMQVGLYHSFGMIRKDKSKTYQL
jgi:hypothetical protein